MRPSNRQTKETENIRKKFKNRTWMGQWNDIEEEERILKGIRDLYKNPLTIQNREPESIRTTDNKI